MFRRSIGLFLVIMLAGPAWADDLAALAKKEKERRAKTAKPVPVLTEVDGKNAPTGSVTALPGPANTPAPTPNSGPSNDEQRAIWKTRAEAARREIVVAQGTLEALEEQYAAYRDDIAEVPANEIQDPMRLQKREARMVEMRAALDRQRIVVANAKKSLTVLEDAARAAGVPPGWLR